MRAAGRSALRSFPPYLLAASAAIEIRCQIDELAAAAFYSVHLFGPLGAGSEIHVSFLIVELTGEALSTSFNTVGRDETNKKLRLGQQLSCSIR